MMSFVPKSIGIFLLTFAFTSVCFAQTDPKNVPQPPTADLKKFDPFLGKYNQTMDYAGNKWSGTLEIRPAVKGWYIERIILTKTAGIDREFHSFITYDATFKRYRVWRFETLPPEKNEGTIRFEGNEVIEEYEFEPGVIFRNRTTMTNKNEMQIITESQDASGKVTQIGITTAKRVQ